MSGKTFKEASTIRTNFHSHTTRCQHATGADEDYVLAAIAAGYSHLGFSDHSPFPYEDGFVSGMRMRIDQYQDYLGSVRELRERYQDQISIHLGVEAEYYERYQGWLAGQLSSGTLEYLILGSHYDLPEESFYFGEANTPALLRRYAEGARVEAIRQPEWERVLILDLDGPEGVFELVIEPMERRCAWLNDQVETLGLDNVEVKRGRAEEYHGAFEVDQVTARAVTALRKLVPLAAPLLRDGGELLLLKGSSVATPSWCSA